MKKHRETTQQEVMGIPHSGIMFLGGHPNMIKKLQRIYPDWDYISDEQMRRKSSFKQHIIFYWTGHSSHLLMEYIYSRISDDAQILYVTATNLPLLLSEMSCAYEALAVG